MLSVLLPVHNAQGKLAAGVGLILEVLAQWRGPFALCILDDGSTDETAEEARELSARFPQVRLIRHPVRLGLGEAIQTGLDHTDGDLILVSGDDYTLDPDDLQTLWRLRDAERPARPRGRQRMTADPRLEKLVALRPGTAIGGFDVIGRQAFEEYRLSQAVGMMHRVDGPRTNAATVVARRHSQPKFLKMAGHFADE